MYGLLHKSIFPLVTQPLSSVNGGEFADQFFQITHKIYNNFSLLHKTFKRNSYHILQIIKKIMLSSIWIKVEILYLRDADLS